MATIRQIWNEHELQMRLLLKRSYLSIGYSAVAVNLLNLGVLKATQDKTKALKIEERTLELVFGIIVTVECRETDVARQKDFDTFLSILSDPVFDTLCDELRTVKSKQVEMTILFMYMSIRTS